MIGSDDINRLTNDELNPVAGDKNSTVGNGNESEPANGDVNGPAEDFFAEIERLQEEVSEQQENYQRAVADLANYRRRKELESTRLIRQAKDSLLSKFLPVADDFERALGAIAVDGTNESWIEGFQLIEKKFWNVLESEGIRPMDSVGEPFDPKLHDAVMVEEGSDSPNTVIEEFQRGYYVGDQVLRPAVVKVGNRDAGEAAE